MDERTMQFGVGLMVLATVIITGVLVLLFGETPAFFKPSYTVFISFNDGSGVTRDTPVKKSGITIGRVTSVELTEDAGALVTVEIDEDRKLRKNEVPRIGSSLIGGDALIAFVKRDDLGLSTDEVKPGDLIIGEEKVDPQSILSSIEDPVLRTLKSLELAGDEIGRLAQQANRLLSTEDDRLSRIVDKSERTLDNLNTTMTNINLIVGDPKLRDSFKEAAEDLPAVLKKAQDRLDDLEVTMASADRALKNVEKITAPFADNPDQLVAKVNSAFSRLDYVLDQAGIFASRINESEGTLSQLLDNPDLYQNLNQAVMNINQLTKDLRPVVGNVRVLTDKASRNPGVFLRDAVRPGAGTKFLH